MIRFFRAVLLVATLATGLPAATYYVDFDGGDDSAAGTSSEAAFKHAPGDSSAAGRAAKVRLAPGDTVLLKGGVHYRGSIRITAKGGDGKPITYDGNTASTFGKGRAVIDGSEPIIGWRRCTSAKECGGNPNWRHLFVASVPGDQTPFTVNLTQGDRSLNIAQDPNPTDPFFEDAIDTYRRIVDPRPAAVSPVRITSAAGMSENSARPYIVMLDGKFNTSAVLDPGKGAAVTFALPKAVTASSVGISFSKSYTMPREVAFLLDGKEVARGKLEKKWELQTFTLPKATTFRELTFKILDVHPGGGGYAACYSVQALDAEGKNLMLYPPVMAYRDEGYFTQTNAAHWRDAWMVVYASPNIVYYQKVLGFDPAAHRLTFEMLQASQYKETGRFTMLNALSILDRAGEYVVEQTPQADGTRRIIAWPLDDARPELLSRSVRTSGIQVSGAEHVVVQGFRVVAQGGPSPATGIGGSGGRHVTIRDNEITLLRSASRNKALEFSKVRDSRIVGNHVHHNRRTGGIHLSGSADCVIEGNRLEKNGATGLSLYSSENIVVARNAVTDHKGMHANGLTAYLSCKNITFDGNRVSGGNVALTIQQGDGMLILNNIFDGGGSTMCVGVWNTDNLTNVSFLNNVFVRSDPKSTWAQGVYFGGRNAKVVGYVMKNNVIDGTCFNRKVMPIDRSHNVYTRRGWVEQQKGWKAGPGELIVEDLAALFVNPVAGDWRPRPGSPLIDAGTKIDRVEDIVGTKVPYGKAPDIGAFEATGK